MQRQLGGSLDGLFYCPHLPDDGCECRKPGLGMIRSATAELEIALDGSWMIGDKEIDIRTGFNAGISTALVRTGYGKTQIDLLDRRPDVIADDLLAAAMKIAELSKSKSSN
jgi:histidinol phosphatase-like enzyme